MSTRALLRVTVALRPQLVRHCSTSSSMPPPPRKKKKVIWTRADVEREAERQRQHEEAVRQARWATSFMTPWERAQMDFAPRNQPLKVWERVYWRLFVVLGGVGFAYETFVLGNRRVLVADPVPVSSNTPSYQPQPSSSPHSSSSSSLSPPSNDPAKQL